MIENPALTAAETAETSLKKIPLPITEQAFKPLSEASAAFAILVQKLHAAEQEIEKLKAEQLAREQRLARIEYLISLTPTVPMDCWCANYCEDLAIGSEVNLMEVPGYWLDQPVSRSAVLYRGTENEKVVQFVERSFNIAPNGNLHPPHGEMTFSEVMNDALMAYTLAIEPGHLKWRPLWRYGILTELTGNLGTVHLNSHIARKEVDDSSSLNLDEKETLTVVPIDYPPCQGRAFEVGDEVLVSFAGQNRTTPKIIGFRREPKQCPVPPKTWQQLR